MPAPPATGTVPYRDRRRVPHPGVNAVRTSAGDASFSGSSPRPLTGASTDPLYGDEFQALARRRIMLTRKPTPMTNEEVDIKPYNLLIPPPTTSRGLETVGRLNSPAESSTDILRAFGKVSGGLRSSRSSTRSGGLPEVESSDFNVRDRTAMIISILGTNITPPHNPDLAGVGHKGDSVRRYYTINNMYSQIF